MADRARGSAAADTLAPFGSGSPQASPDTGEVTLPLTGGAALLAEIVRRLDAAGVAISDIAVRQPTLDDVFLALTGRTAETSQHDMAVSPNGRRGALARRGK